jgi:hypothetical protein
MPRSLLGRALGLASALATGLVTGLPLDAAALPMDASFVLTSPPTNVVQVGESETIGDGQAIPAEVDGNTITFGMIFLPNISGPTGEVITVSILTTPFDATLTAGTGAIVTETITAHVKVDAGAGGIQEGDIQFVLTTGTVSRPACGSVGAAMSSGSPLDMGDKATLLASICINELGSDPTFNQVFTLRLTGTFVEAPAPEPAAALMLLAAASLGVTLRYRARR